MIRWLPAMVLVIGAAVACGTRLTATDAHAVQLQLQDCSDVAARLGDAGPSSAAIRAEARACACGARGILLRAGESVPDAAAGCPQ